MSRLASFIEEQGDALLLAWIAQVRDNVAPSDATTSELRNHIPLFLNQLVVALRHGPSVASDRPAVQHGRQRHRIGFDVEMLVHEYGILRDIILDAAENHRVFLSLGEVRIFIAFISDAIAEGLAEYNRQRAEDEKEAAETSLRAVQEREARLSTTLASIGDAVISTNQAGEITYINAVAEQLTGWHQEMAYGRSAADVFKIFDTDDAPLFVHPVEEILDRQDSSRRGRRRALLLSKDDERVPIEHNAAPITTPNGQCTGTVVVFRSTAEQNRAEAEREALLEQALKARRDAMREREHIEALFMQAPMAVAIVEGPQHTFTLANEAYRDLVGQVPLMGKPVLEALPNLGGQGIETLLTRVLTTGEAFLGNELPVRLHADGANARFFNFVYSPLYGDGAQATGVMICAVEVTEQVQGRQQLEALAARLKKSEETLRRVVEAADAGTWDLDVKTGSITADARLLQLMDAPPDGRFNLESALNIHVFSEDRSRVQAAMDAAMAQENGGRYVVEFRIGARGRVMRWVESRAQATFDASGKALHLAGIMIDITSRKRAEDLTKKHAQFEQHLIGIVSHDLKNPLGAISMSAQMLLRNDAMPQRERDRARRISAASERAIRMVRDLLDFTQARLSGHIPINRQDVDLFTVLKNVVLEVQASQPGRQIELKGKSSRTAHCDPDRITQIVQNLLVNAVKYGRDDSPVTVSAELTASRAILAVHNWGQVITPEMQQFIFEPLTRAHASAGKEAGSVGLGLYIVSVIAKAHGGDVRVESSQAAGTTFTVDLLC